MKLFLTLILIFVFSPGPSANADEAYLVGSDNNGIYLETESDGSWYIGNEDLEKFKVGEQGSYSSGQDRNGTYIKTTRHGKHYIDEEAVEALEQEIEDINKANAVHETKILVHGNSVLIPVTLGYNGKEIETLLVLDTGATHIVLHREIADNLSVKADGKTKLLTAGGHLIEADIAKLSYAEAGPFKKKNMIAYIIDYEGPPVKNKGLLGMNFLKGIDFQIDMERKVIRWKVNDEL